MDGARQDEQRVDGRHEHHPGAHSHGRRRGLLETLGMRAPHSHDTADKVDAALETSDEGIRAVKVSLVALGLTTVLQAAVVAVSGSVALLGDTLHNLADALTALPLWLAFTLGRRPRNRRYTYGYGRAEDVAGVVIVAAIALSAAAAGWESLQRLIEPRPVRNLAVVAAAGVVGFVGNEWVARYRMRVGRRIGSAALVADGLHARTDGFTSLAVVLGAAGVAAGFVRADALVGLGITVAIAFVLRSAVRDVLRRLLDAVDPTLVDRVEEVLRAVPGVRDVPDVRLRWIGHRLRAEVEVEVDDTLTVVEGHDVAERAHHELLHRIPRLDAALVHFSPRGTEHGDHHAETAHHFPERR